MQRHAASLRCRNSTLDVATNEEFIDPSVLLGIDMQFGADSRLRIVRTHLLEQACIAYMLAGDSDEALRIARSLRDSPWPQAQIKGLGLEALCHATGSEIQVARAALESALEGFHITQRQAAPEEYLGVSALAIANLLIDVREANWARVADSLFSVKLAADAEGLRTPLTEIIGKLSAVAYRSERFRHASV